MSNDPAQLLEPHTFHVHTNYFAIVAQGEWDYQKGIVTREKVKPHGEHEGFQGDGGRPPQRPSCAAGWGNLSFIPTRWAAICSHTQALRTCFLWTWAAMSSSA